MRIAVFGSSLVSAHWNGSLNCSATTALGVNREGVARFGFSPPARSFEAAGAGACVVADARPGLDLFLAPGREVVVAHHVAEVGDRLGALTNAWAGAIGEADGRRVLAEEMNAQPALEVEAALGVRAARESA